jgi:hypothetical protein
VSARDAGMLLAMRSRGEVVVGRGTVVGIWLAGWLGWLQVCLCLYLLKCDAAAHWCRQASARPHILYLPAQLPT